MLKSSKFVAQLLCNRWSNIADCLTFFEAFSRKIGNHHVFILSGIKGAEGFSIISNLVVTTLITKNYFGENFFSSESLNRSSVLNLYLDLKIAFSLQCGKSLSIARLNLVLKSSDS